MVRLRILGECAIELGDGRLYPGSQVLFGAMLLLALDPGRRVARQELMDALWPGSDADAARHNLRQAVYRLRQMGAAIVSDGGQYVLPRDEVHAPHERLATPEGVDEIFARVAPPIGAVLPGYESGLSDRLDEWVDQQRTLIGGRIRRALVHAMERYRARARWGEVEVLARKILVFDPLNEEATLVLAESAAMSGSKRYALTILDRYLEELGPESSDIRLPAAVLRRRISERLPEPRWRAVSEAAFVGRAEDMEKLGRLLQSARNGEGNAVLLWGEPGIGKTRLAEELWKVAALQANTQLAKVCCQPSDARRPLSIFADVVPDLQKLPGALGCSPRSLQLLKRLTEYDVNATGPSEDAREAEYLYASIKRSIFDLVDAVQEDNCLVVVIEDVHWLDAESWKVLRELIPWSARRRILWVMTSRMPHATDEPDEETPKFLVKHRVGPIDVDAGVTLVELMVREREREPDVAFRDWSVSVAEGNPFFLRELTTYWLQTGKTYEVPDSLQALIDDRLDRLSARALQVLQAIAILGAVSTHSRLERMLTLPHWELFAAVDELERSGLIVPTQFGAEPKHHLLAQGALNRAREVARRLLHRRAAQILEEDSSGANAEIVWACAEHWALAGEPEQSVSHPLRAARHLLEIGLPGQAAGVLEQALSHDLDEHLRLNILWELGRALSFAGEWLRAHRTLRDALSLRQRTPNLDQTPGLLDVLFIESQLYTGADRNDILPFACGLVRDKSIASSVAIAAAFQAIRMADSCADYECVERIFSDAEQMHAENDHDRALLECVRVIYHSACGGATQALKAAERMMTACTASAAPVPVRGRMMLAHSRAIYRAGEFGRGFRSAADALRFGEEHRLAELTLPAALQLANWYAEHLNIGEASRYAHLAEDCLDRNSNSLWPQEIDCTAARVALLQANSATARERMKQFESTLFDDRTLRRRLMVQAVWVEIALIESANLPDRQLAAAFLELFEVCANRGNVDYPASIAVRLLVRTRDTQTGQSALRRYLRDQRRECEPAPPLLVSLLR